MVIYGRFGRIVLPHPHYASEAYLYGNDGELKEHFVVIQLRIRKEPPVDVHDEALFFRVIRAAFAQRRKTAVNSISNTLHMSKQQVTDAFEQAGVRANSRAEALTLPEFAAVVNQLTD